MRRETTTVQPLISEAFMFLGQSQYAKAIELLQQVTRIEPDNRVAWRHLVPAHIALQQWEPALDASNHALVVHSQSGYARGTLLQFKAAALMVLERYEDALATYEDGLKIDIDT